MTKFAELNQIKNGRLVLTKGCFRVRFRTTLSTLVIIVVVVVVVAEVVVVVIVVVVAVVVVFVFVVVFIVVAVNELNIYLRYMHAVSTNLDRPL